MGPIYWDPVHDVSSVVRGTWFYKDSMLPVDPDLANQLEEGYEYIKPWTLTYQDELKSCLEVGPEAELKITHRLYVLPLLWFPLLYILLNVSAQYSGVARPQIPKTG